MGESNVKSEHGVDVSDESWLACKLNIADMTVLSYPME